MAGNDVTSLKLEIDQLALAGMSKELVTAVLISGTDAVHDSIREIEQAIEASFRGAVKGNAWRAVKSDARPRRGVPAYNPSAAIFANGPAGGRSEGMLVYWSQPGVNQAADGRWRAIPLPGAGVTTSRRNLTPRAWEQRTGLKLRMVKPPKAQGRWALLVTDGTVTRTSDSKAIKKLTSRPAAQGRQQVTEAIFILIPFQRFANTVRLEPSIARGPQLVEANFAKRLARLNGA